jgi:5-methylcytosine-specific restriction endonuclease McrA
MPEAATDYAAGAPMRVLAERYGVSVPTVRDVLTEAGVTIRTSRESAKIRWADPEYREYRVAALEHRRRPTGVRDFKRLLAQDAVCAWCEIGASIEQHHLNGVRSDHRPENIVPLCRDCHAKAEWLIHHATEGLRRAYRGEAPDLRLGA